MVHVDGVEPSSHASCAAIVVVCLAPLAHFKVRTFDELQDHMHNKTWCFELDLNQRPLGYQPNALTN